MPEPNNGRADPVAALANRLRLVQIDFADQDEDVRREYLSDEIDRALASIVPAERAAFLRELDERFPTWDRRVDVESSASPQRGAFDEKELRDPSFLVTRLVELSASFGEEQRRAVVARLAEAGLTPPGKPQWPQAPAAEVRAKLQLAAGEELDAPRVLELLATLAEFSCSLDQVVWNTWRAIAPSTTVQRPQALRKTLGRYAVADQAVPRGQVVQDVTKLRQLIAALVAAIPQAGRLAAEHAREFSPEQIQALVGTGGFGSEGRCWRKYVELAAGVDSASVEDRIRQEIAAYAETLIRGTGRKGNDEG